MYESRVVTVAAAALALSGCATTSFAPPSVNLTNAMETVGSNRRSSRNCIPHERLQGDSRAKVELTEDIAGAYALIDNFVLTYRCEAHMAADGRQAFEVPAFLALTGAAAAAAFGAGPNVAIAGGATSAVVNGGKAYYDPKAKAAMYSSALDALLCIKSAAAGVEPINIETKATLEAAVNAIGSTRDRSGLAIQVTADKQFHTLIYSSLLSVERVLAQRLSNAGTPFDAAGVIAEIEKLSAEAQKAREAEASANDAAAQLTEQAQNAVEGEAPGSVSATDSNFKAAFVNRVPRLANEASVRRTLDLLTQADRTERRVATATLDLGELQPKLQQCVVRAKI